MEQKLEIKKMDLKPKFDLSILMSVGITIVVVAIMLAFGLQIMGDVKDDMDAGTLEANATQDGLEAVGKISGKLGIIVTVVIAGILIAILLRYLYVKM